jgi:hypothetical protein
VQSRLNLALGDCVSGRTDIASPLVITPVLPRRHQCNTGLLDGRGGHRGGPGAASCGGTGGARPFRLGLAGDRGVLLAFPAPKLAAGWPLRGNPHGSLARRCPAGGVGADQAVGADPPASARLRAAILGPRLGHRA